MPEVTPERGRLEGLCYGGLTIFFNDLPSSGKGTSHLRPTRLTRIVLAA